MKTCSRCKQTLPRTEFRLNDKKKGYYRSECKTCGLEDRRVYYQNNTAKVKATSHRIGKKKRADQKAFLDDYKAFLGCFVCGEEKPWRLIFHHLSEKNRAVGWLAGGNFDRLLGELKLCVVLCANCHADVHIGRGMVAKTRRAAYEMNAVGNVS